MAYADNYVPCLGLMLKPSELVPILGGGILASLVLMFIADLLPYLYVQLFQTLNLMRK